jgi:hypothetical protein
MTPLRQRMIDDMQLRNLAARTQKNYIAHVAGFAKYFGRSPAELDIEAVRQYQLYLLNERKLSPESVNQYTPVGDGHAMGVAAEITFQKWMQAVNLLNPAAAAPIREISDSDAPHRINISSVWSLPFGKGRALLNSTNGFVSRIVGGWELSGIWSLQSGFALPWNNMIYYGDPANIQLPLNQRTPEHWFNTDGFEMVSTKQMLANQVRTWPFRFSNLRGPRQNNIDIALIKQTRISEGKNIEFRAEALNAANHPLFPNPNMTATGGKYNLSDTG